jgi:hypothetical protein
MRPTPQVVVSMENALDIGIVEICTRFEKRKMGWRDIIPVITAGLRGGGNDGGISDEKIAEIVFDEGMSEKLFLAVLEFLGGCLGGKKSIEEEPRPTPAKVTRKKASTS